MRHCTSLQVLKLCHIFSLSFQQFRSPQAAFHTDKETPHSRQSSTTIDLVLWFVSQNQAYMFCYQYARHNRFIRICSSDISDSLQALHPRSAHAAAKDLHSTAALHHQDRGKARGFMYLGRHAKRTWCGLSSILRIVGVC